MLSFPLLEKSGVASLWEMSAEHLQSASWQSLKHVVPLVKNVPKRSGRHAFCLTVAQYQCATVASPAADTISVGYNELVQQVTICNVLLYEIFANLHQYEGSPHMISRHCDPWEEETWSSDQWSQYNILERNLNQCYQNKFFTHLALPPCLMPNFPSGLSSSSWIKRICSGGIENLLAGKTKK